MSHTHRDESKACGICWWICKTSGSLSAKQSMSRSPPQDTDTDVGERHRELAATELAQSSPIHSHKRRKSMRDVSAMTGKLIKHSHVSAGQQPHPSHHDHALMTP